MNGVFVEKNGDRLIMVATDGRRLAYSGKIIDPEVDDFKGVIVPPKVLSVVRRLVSREGELKLGVTDKNFHVEYDSQHLTSNLIDAQFPNYQRVIPDHQEHQIVIDRAALEEALRRVALLVEQKSRRIHLETTADNLTIRSSEGDIGAAREDVPCEFRGPEVVLAFNYVYLLDPLREMATDKVTLEFTDPGKALSLKPIPESDYHHVVMPMQAG
jgi:DNA polymerase-3 subunit beta